MKYLIALLMLIMPNLAHGAGDYFLKYGLGMNNGNFPNTSVKLISLGRIAPLYSLIDYQLEGGIFDDNSQPQGIIGFAGASLGVRTKSPGLYASFFIGPSLVTETDTRLASIFEFNNDLEVGVRDSRGLSIGINYKHFSNAGLTPNNIGRDFFTIKLTLPLQ